MPTVAKLLENKSIDVAWLPPDATVLDAARLMNERRIGSVVVLDDGRLAGIFTERDVMVRVVAAQLDPADTALADVMTTPVACAAPHTTSDELRAVIREKRIRHIPVVDQDKVIGLVSIGDLNRSDQDGQARTIQYLSEFMSRA